MVNDCVITDTSSDGRNACCSDAVRCRMSWMTPAALSGRFALYRDPHPARVASFAEDVRTGLGYGRTRCPRSTSMTTWGRRSSKPSAASPSITSPASSAICWRPIAVRSSPRSRHRSRSSSWGAERNQDAAAHRGRAGTSAAADVSPDRHLARGVDRIVARAACRARSAQHPGVRIRLSCTFARAQAEHARPRPGPVPRVERRQFQPTGARTVRPAGRLARRRRRTWGTI